MSSSKGKGKATDETTSDQDLLPWVEKYRPDSMDDLVAHEDITSTLVRFADQRRLPHLLFYGPPGTGKTSTILALARKLYGSSLTAHVLELNASDERGIDVVRERIKSFASMSLYTAQSDPGAAAFKLVILDEADAMTQAAQGALRRVVEQYTKNVRFCIICNYVNKIIPAIQSRCTRFRFSPLSTEQIESRLDLVIEQEHVNITDNGKEALRELSQGDMRRALNILQACHSAYDPVSADAVYSCTGAPQPADVQTILQEMLESDFTTAYKAITQLKASKGLALADVLNSLYALLQTYGLAPAARVMLLDHLATAEYRLSTGASEKVQLSALLGAVKLAMEINKRSTAA